MVILCLQLAVREFSKISLDPNLSEAMPINTSMNMEAVAKFIKKQLNLIKSNNDASVLHERKLADNKEELDKLESIKVMILPSLKIYVCTLSYIIITST